MSHLVAKFENNHKTDTHVLKHIIFAIKSPDM